MGVNGLYEREAPYGTIKRLEQTTKELGTPSTPAVNAPKRAQRAAVNRPSASVQQTAQTPEDYHAQVAEVFAYYASLPGASPLVQEYAARQWRQVNLGSR
jgi:hypothetical protein